MPIILSDKQNEYIRNSTHRWNIKTGAVRSGKSFETQRIRFRIELENDLENPV